MFTFQTRLVSPRALGQNSTNSNWTHLFLLEIFTLTVQIEAYQQKQDGESSLGLYKMGLVDKVEKLPQGNVVAISIIISGLASG